jgi:hypothetical protein
VCKYSYSFHTDIIDRQYKRKNSKIFEIFGNVQIDVRSLNEYLKLNEESINLSPDSNSNTMFISGPQ